jgi:hypothetical protein
MKMTLYFLANFFLMFHYLILKKKESKQFAGTSYNILTFLFGLKIFLILVFLEILVNFFF